jgi:hypothetical protein
MPVGLCLENPTRARVWDYASTPVDSTTFGSTGGDGVHFSVLHTGRGNGYAPVVMTVPMAFDAPNHIVGGILREFLGLGCRTGYRCLETSRPPMGAQRDDRPAVRWPPSSRRRTRQAAPAPGQGVRPAAVPSG